MHAYSYYKEQAGVPLSYMYDMGSILPAVPPNYDVVINATEFSGNAVVNVTLGMPVIRFKVTINNTFFQDPDAVIISVVRSAQTDAIFKLENGDNTESIIDPASGLPPSTAVIDIERAVVYFSDPPDTFELPALFTFDINVAVTTVSSSGNLLGETEALGMVLVRGKSFL